MKPTIYDIAQEAGVSIATVSRAFHSNTRISVQTRQRIIEIADAMGYCPSASARNLANRSTETMALLVPHLSNPFFTELIRGVESVSKEQHFNLLIYTCLDLDEKDDSFLQLLPSRIDGFVLGSHSSTGQYIRKLDKLGFPFVLLGEGLQGVATDTVRPDNQWGAYKMTCHLIDVHHHDKIAFISGPKEQNHSEERLVGYMQALNEHQIPIQKEWMVQGMFNEKSGYEVARQLLLLPNPPKAIFAGNDLMAIGVRSAAMEMGIAVPTELAIVGFDDIPSARYLQPALTTVNVRSFEQGRQAAERLFERMAQPDMTPVDSIMSTKLVIRNSCGCTVVVT